MTEILTLLPVLATAIAMNIMAGIYYNIGTQKMDFEWKIFVAGIVKAAIVAGMFVGTAYCFEYTDLSSIGVTPELLMNSAIILYVGKAVTSLGKILGVSDTLKHEE